MTACHLAGAKPLSEPMMEYCSLDLGNKFQWKFHPNTTIFIQENAFENVVWEMAVILPQPQYVKTNSHNAYSKFITHAQNNKAGSGEKRNFPKCLAFNSLIEIKKMQTLWRHQMDTFSALLAICTWNLPVISAQHLNTLRHETNNSHVADDILKWISWIKMSHFDSISPTFIPNNPTDNSLGLGNILVPNRWHAIKSLQWRHNGHDGVSNH